MNLTSQPIELFFQQLTYLPFKDVISISQTCSCIRNYCTNIRYSKFWKRLIDDTFSDAFNYTDKLQKIWQDLGFPRETYNYLVYTNLAKLLPSITQLLIYYKQGDMESFNSDKFTDKQRFLASFLLGGKDTAKFLPSTAYQPFIDLMNGIEPSENALNDMMIEMVKEGSPLGTIMFLEKGADISYKNYRVFRYASQRGYLDIVKYLVSQGVFVSVKYDFAFRYASQNGHLDVVKYLVNQGADIRAADDWAFKWASNQGHLDVVKYLVEQGADIHAEDDWAFRWARINRHRDVVKYLKSLLVENGK